MSEEDKRATKRWRTVLKGRVVFNDQASVLDCTVRDLSQTGAQIHFADVSIPPQEFTLEIQSKDVRAQAGVVWSRGANHGIEFVDEAAAWVDPTRKAAE